MFDTLLLLLGLVYVVVILLLFFFSSNYIYLIFLTLRHSRKSLPKPVVTSWPKVTVQLPIFNEMYVAARLVNAAAALDYPKDLLQIQVLDDSTDDTLKIINSTVEEIKSRGIDIEHITRTNRTGYKAGALAAATPAAKGEYIALFDADFIPPKDFLRQTIPHLTDPQVAFVQTRWGHTNRDYSLLTLLQSLTLDAHFMVDQFSRFINGFWFNFNGTGGVWRKTAIIDAGGWTSDTLTEDLDLSYRAFLNGWRAIFLADVVSPAELPVNFTAYRRQQHRWARGGFEVAKKLLAQIWRKDAPIFKKLQATLHLTSNSVYVLLFILVLLYPVALILSAKYAVYINTIGLYAGILLNIAALAPTLYFITAQHLLKRPWWKMLPQILFVNLFSAGMMLNTTRAAFEAFFSKKKVFERTPKYSVSNKTDKWLKKNYQLKLDKIIFLELLTILLNLVTIFTAIALENQIIAVYAIIFTLGLMFTSTLTFAQWLAMVRKNRKS